MTNDGIIRPTVPEDTARLLVLAEETHVFKPIEITALDEVLADYHATMQRQGHQSVTFEMKRTPQGFAYFAPAAMTDRTWYLYWIAVATDIHGNGVGSTLLRHVEDCVREKTGRQLLIETSSMPHYDRTRRFYVRQGYEIVAVIPDYYAAGDDMVVFQKKLS